MSKDRRVGERVDEARKVGKREACRRWHAKNRGYSTDWRRRNRDKAIARERKYRAANQDLLREKAREWRAKNKDRIRGYGYSRFYGLTRAQVGLLYSNQNGKCAICGKPLLIDGKKGMCVDHDHGTGNVRGLLCGTCNLALGYFKDSIEILNAAANYLDLAELLS